MLSKTFSITINRDAKSVYAFVSDLQNLPKWAKAFCLSIKKENADTWIGQTPQGEVRFKMTTKNTFGVLDHTVIPAPGVEVYVPMRVVANGEGSEIIFTLFKMPNMSDEQFARDQGLVQQDLASLKEVLEKI